MTTLKTKAHIDASGTITLNLPTVPEMANADVDVVVMLSPIAKNGATPHTVNGADARSAWAHIDRFVGTIDDPTFERPPQGEFEKREPLD